MTHQGCHLTFLIVEGNSHGMSILLNFPEKGKCLFCERVGRKTFSNELNEFNYDCLNVEKKRKQQRQDNPRDDNKQTNEDGKKEVFFINFFSLNNFLTKILEVIL